MIGWSTIEQMRAERGPRHLVHGTVRRNEFRAVYATSAEAAEQAAERMREDGLRQVQILAPPTIEADHAELLQQTGKNWRTAKDAETDLRQQLAAAVVTAVGDGMSESRAARLAGVDRMTVRSWLGKRR